MGVYRNNGLSMAEKQVYNYFFYLSWQKIIMNKSFDLPFQNSHKGDTYLRCFNIFAVAQPNEQMMLVSPRFVAHLMWKNEF